MSSLIQAFGGTSHYQPLEWIPPVALARKRHVVLIVLDGFGYEYLMRQRETSLFRQYLKGSLTSVFPSTTASGITTFLTGLAPQQHAVTGWFMYLKEFGSVATSLLFEARCTAASLRRNGIGADMVYGHRPIFREMNRAVYSVQHKHLQTAEYNTKMNQSPHKRSFRSLAGIIRRIATIVRSRKEATFTYAYWSEFDRLCHHYGTGSPEVDRHYKELEQAFAKLVDVAARTDTAIIITADHGLLDTERKKIVEVKHHPELREALALPLCGEPRVAYCYVRPSKTAQFEQYVTTQLDGKCDLFRSEDLIARNYFGLFEPDLRLFDRVGDYVLIMQENYVVKDFLLGEKEKFHIGNHGGISREEMLVPVIIFGECGNA
jgi:hypothetical protein